MGKDVGFHIVSIKTGDDTMSENQVSRLSII